MHAEVTRVMGRPVLSDTIEVSPPNHPVALDGDAGRITGHQTGSFPGLCCVRTASTGGPGAHCA